MIVGANQDLEALRAAVYLLHLQTGVRAAREQPLPAGMPLLLEVAAGDAEATAAAASRLERSADVVRAAAAFYLEHVVIVPDGDAYRILAASREATDAELRRNMALLQRWAHPDLDPSGERAAFAGRVTRSWEALKTPDRRAAYEAANPARRAKLSSPGSGSPGSGSKLRVSSTGQGSRSASSGSASSSSGSQTRSARKPSRTRALIGHVMRLIVGARRTGR